MAKRIKDPFGANDAFKPNTIKSPFQVAPSNQPAHNPYDSNPYPQQFDQNPQ